MPVSGESGGGVAQRTHELEGVAEAADDAGEQCPVAVVPVANPGADAGLGQAERREIQECDVQDESQDEEALQKKLKLKPCPGPCVRLW